MAVTVDDVRAVAALAKLELSASEEQRLVGDFNRILGYMAKLDELDTEGVSPTSHAVPAKSTFRRDEVDPFPGRAELLAAAPLLDGDYYKVPRIID
jgi:aspartyl-tRNA(Asn)/glutamyl-tRNA(Gln) amidotransferase subunit C